MKNFENESAKEILCLLESENLLLDKILENQKNLRSSVLKKDWDVLEKSIHTIEVLSSDFAHCDEDLMNILGEYEISGASDFYQALKNLKTQNEDCAQKILSKFNDVKRKVLQSKIENKSISEYVKMTNNFLQGVFNKVLPGRKVYSKKGALVQNQPSSIVLNAIL